MLDSEEEVDLYKEAGDTVATNKHGTAGVKITDEDEQGCPDTLTEKLASLGEN